MRKLRGSIASTSLVRVGSDRAVELMQFIGICDERHQTYRDAAFNLLAKELGITDEAKRVQEERNSLRAKAPGA